MLVGCAGVSLVRPMADMTFEEWRRVMAVNLDGIFLGAKHALQAMQLGHGGSIVIVSSASGIRAGAGRRPTAPVKPRYAGLRSPWRWSWALPFESIRCCREE